MSDFTRQTMLEDVFNDMYGIKPEVYYQRIDRNTYKIKLVYNGKEAILTEIMENGLTKTATLEYIGAVKNHKSMYNAEKEAVEFLRSE